MFIPISQTSHQKSTIVYLNIVVKNKMSRAIFCQQIKSIVVCKVFKLQHMANRFRKY